MKNTEFGCQANAVLPLRNTIMQRLSRFHVLDLRRWGVFTALLVTLGAAANLPAQSSPGTLIGRWDLTLSTPKGELPSWIELSNVNGKNSLVMVGVTDHATPLQKFTIRGNDIEFTSPKGEEGFANDMVFKGKLVGQRLEGTVSDTAGEAWHWKGVRSPQLIRKTSPVWSDPISLFDGKDLNGWHFSDSARGGAWKAEEGLLVKSDHGSELVTDSKFQDFKLHAEFKCGPSSNSGIFLRGRYEVQIETDSSAEPNSHHTGGVYGFLDPIPEQPRKDDVWQTFDITLLGRKITIVHNGVTVIDSKEIPGITGGAIDSNEALPGPIYLQGSEEGIVTYKKLILTPAK